MQLSTQRTTRPATQPATQLSVQHETIGEFLGALAARVPAPGGGAAAGLHAAVAAALLGMVARYTTGHRYAEHAERITELIDATDRWRADALRSAQDDAQAFGAVAKAYGLPKGTPEARRTRSAAIARALTLAAQPPTAVIGLAHALLPAARELRTIGNRSVLADVAAAAEAVRAAAVTARINVEVNLPGITDAAVRTDLRNTAGTVDRIVIGADEITAAVRAEIAG
ncbi:cyclodeaminase/cyclohydrolase family protein [Streptomyces sp. NPDC056716]|uniref:cyclodeaminase/cyclohydrolase family protein n=1 Tax=unclassified Streptomyces TaxID=2593676 RepID=UPI003697DEEA